MPFPYRNQSIDLLYESIDWFLYERKSVKGLTNIFIFNFNTVVSGIY